ncbi:kinesin-like protein KIF19 [Dendropsophus ebraccatus]|uniref:kinesin-like protein KIF19 n=1 Tax=Dendropsophus ebraccatus TaxID=150705 RepID=UPI0038314883
MTLPPEARCTWVQLAKGLFYFRTEWTDSSSYRQTISLCHVEKAQTVLGLHISHLSDQAWAASLLSTESGIMKNAKDDFQYHHITVAVRIRPLNNTEMEEGAQCITYKRGEQMLLLKDPNEDPDDVWRANRSRQRTFVFDAVMDQYASQDCVYESTTKSLVEGIVSGYNATVFAYGPTGTGKTYTMLGIDGEPGIFYRTLNDLFRTMEEISDGTDYSVSVSYLEIYNELIRDLINPSSGFLELREDTKGNIQIAGITEVFTHNAEESIVLLKKGNRHRTQEPTAANKTSSRSHAVLQVIVKYRSKSHNVHDELRTGKLFMIDLAGSERAAQTQNRGQRMKEGAHINRSLLALGNCITALSERGGSHAHHINYRDSKLTRLLKDALGGNSRTVMIVHISPAAAAFEESRTTLIYASRAKNIKNRVKRNYESVAQHITRYSGLIANLNREIHQLQSSIRQYGRELREMKDMGLKIRARRENENQNDSSDQDPTSLEEQIIIAFQEHMEVRRSLLQLNNANMEMRIDAIRHLATIADWEQEKAQESTRPRREKASEDIVLDAGDEEEEEEADVVEPPEVMMAREEINTLLAEQKKTASLMAELEHHWEKAKLKTSQLEQMIPEQLGGDQREVFRLLHKLHELQVWNTELRARSACRDSSLLYQKDFVILSYQQYRSLCEKIILLQKALLGDDKVHSPELLEKLHHSYAKEIENGTIGRLEQLHSLLSGRLKDHTAQDGVDPENCGGSLLHLDIEQLEKAVGDKKKRGVSRTRYNLSPYAIDSDSDCRTAKSSPVLKPKRQNSSLSLTPFHHLRTPVHPTVNNPSKESKRSLAFPDSFDPVRRHSLSVLPLTPEALEEIAAGTRSISLVAAKRRSKVASNESSFILKKKNALPSLHVPKTPRILLRPPVRKAVSNESLAAIALRRDETTKIGNSKNLHRQKSWGKRSHSFEAPSSQLTYVKPHSIHMATSDRSHRTLPHSGFPTRPARPGSKDKVLLNTKTYVRSKEKKSIPNNVPSDTGTQADSDQQTEEGPLQVLQATRTPPSMIQQINAGSEKGQVLHKRIKGPGEVTTGKSRSAFPRNLHHAYTAGKNPSRPGNGRK